MPKKLPIATQQQILKLEQRVFKLEKKIAAQKSNYEKRIATLKAENQQLRSAPITITEERLEQLQAARRAVLERMQKDAPG
jgi:hypothetical protein